MKQPTQHNARQAAHGAGRRFFLPIGVERPGGTLRDLAGVPGDLERMRDVFAGRGYDVVPFANDPTPASLRDGFAEWLERAQPGHQDAVTIYFSGHGAVVDSDHYLCARGFDMSRPATTGFKTQDLVELALRRSPRPGRLWLILDCCQAGGVLSDGFFRALGSSESDTFVLAASGSWSPTFDGSFSGAFRDSLAEDENVGGAALDHLTELINMRRSGPSAIQAGISSRRFDLLDRY